MSKSTGASGPSIITDGLVLLIDAANNRSYPKSGTTWYDLIGNNNGTLISGVTFNGSNRGGLVFNGTSTSTSMPAVFTTYPFTISIWCTNSSAWTPTVETMQELFNLSIDGQRIGLGIVNNPLWNGILGLMYGGSSQWTAGNSPTKTGENDWHNITWVVYGNNDNNHKIYFDGVLQTMYDNGGTYGGVAGWNIGSNSANGEYWNGKIPNVFGYDRVLSSTEVLQNYNALRGRYALTITAPSNQLELTFNDIANADLLIGGSSSNVTDWNTFFDLPVNGTAFSSVSVVGNVVNLFGGSNIHLKDYLFDSMANNGLISIVDGATCIISAGIGSLGSDDFGGCVDLTTISLPSLTTAGDWCFSYNPLLSTVSLPSLTAAGVYCFAGCELLVSPDFSVLTTAGDYCFISCTGLISSFPSLTTAGVSCFQNCTGLISSFPVLTTAGANCFAGCTGLISSNFSSLTTAGDYCFADCIGLVSPSFPLLTTAGDSCFQNCTGLINPNFSVLTSAGTGCFNGCIGLISNFSSLTTAGIGCFIGCIGLISPDFSSLTTAGDNCFNSCTGLVSPNFSALTTAGDSCFIYCTSLTSINLPVLTNLGPTVGEDYVFSGIIGNTITLTIPSALMTCNDGVTTFDPDGDIQYLDANNTLTIIQL